MGGPECELVAILADACAIDGLAVEQPCGAEASPLEQVCELGAVFLVKDVSVAGYLAIVCGDGGTSRGLYSQAVEVFV